MPMSLTTRRRLLRALQILVAAGLLVLVWQIADGAEALTLLAGANGWWLAAAVSALTLQTFVSAARWRVTAGQLGLTIPPGRALREYYVAQIVNQTLPGGVLGDVGRAIRSRSERGLLASSQAVILERIAGQLALYAIMLVAVATTAAISGGLEWPWQILAAVTVLSAVVMLLVTMLGAVSRRHQGKLTRLVAGLLSQVARVWWAPAVRWRQLFYSFATALLNILGFTFCAWAVGADLALSAALALVPLVLFTMLIPVTVSGWGLREGAAALLLPLAGLLPTEGLAASAGFGLVFLLVSLPGALFLAGSSRAVTS